MRETGLAIDFEIIERCDELWLCGRRVSPGMKLEATHAWRNGKDVFRVLDMAGQGTPRTPWAPE